MADGIKKRGLSSEKWAELRAAYEAGSSIASLSKRFGVRRETIHNRRDREAWTVGVSGHVSGRTEASRVREIAQARVIDIKTKQAIEIADQSGIAEEIAAEMVAVAKLKTGTAEYILSLVEKARQGKIRPASSPGEQTEADVAKSVMSAVAMFSKTLREGEGRTAGQPTIPNAKKASIVRRFRLVPAEPIEPLKEQATG